MRSIMSVVESLRAVLRDDYVVWRFLGQRRSARSLVAWAAPLAA
jgi:hypothetical protein